MTGGIRVNRKAQGYDTAKYDVWALPRPILLPWVLNPGAAFNEIILGQRLPRIMLIERHSPRPFAERSFVPCPSCGTIHPGRLWSGRSAFGHWLGYVCPTCGEFIPSLWNVFSLVLVVALTPLWIGPLLIFRERWRQYELRRVRRALESLPVRAKKIAWVRTGVLSCGGMMWLLCGVVPQLWAVARGRAPDWLDAAVQLPIWLLAGYGWGVWMRRWMNKPGTPVSQDHAMGDQG